MVFFPKHPSDSIFSGDIFPSKKNFNPSFLLNGKIIIQKENVSGDIHLNFSSNDETISKISAQILSQSEQENGADKSKDSPSIKEHEWVDFTMKEDKKPILIDIDHAANQLKQLHLQSSQSIQMNDNGKLEKKIADRLVFTQAAIEMGFRTPEGEADAKKAQLQLKQLGLTVEDVSHALNNQMLLTEVKERTIFRDAAKKVGFSTGKGGEQVNNAIKELKLLGFTSQYLLTLNENELEEEYNQRDLSHQAAIILDINTEEGEPNRDEAFKQLIDLGFTSDAIVLALYDNTLLEDFQTRKIFSRAGIELNLNAAEGKVDVNAAIKQLKPLGFSHQNLLNALDNKTLLKEIEERKIFKQASAALGFKSSDEGKDVNDAIKELTSLDVSLQKISEFLGDGTFKQKIKERKLFVTIANLLENESHMLQLKKLGVILLDAKPDVESIIKYLKSVGLTAKQILALDQRELIKEIETREIARKTALLLDLKTSTNELDVNDAGRKLKNLGFSSEDAFEALSQGTLKTQIEERKIMILNQAERLIGLSSDFDGDEDFDKLSLRSQEIINGLKAYLSTQRSYIGKPFEDLQPLEIPYDQLNRVTQAIVNFILNTDIHAHLAENALEETRSRFFKFIDQYIEIDDQIKFLQTVGDNPKLMEKDPTFATRAHDILHNFAQEEIKAGNVARAFEIEVNVAQSIPLSKHHPLYDMDRAIQEGVAKQFDPKSGAYFSSLGGSSLKGGNLHASKRTIDQRECYCFDFKISHFARDELTSYLDAIIDNEQKFKDALPEHLKDVFELKRGEKQQFDRYDDSTGAFTVEGGYDPNHSQATILSFRSIGRIIIGNDKENGCMYNRISVEIDINPIPGEGIKHFHQILACAGIGSVLGKQEDETSERMKIAQLLRAYYPMIGTELDVKKEFYQLSIEKLKQKVIELEPRISDIFKKYLETSPELMQKIEIVTGKEMWGVMDLGSEMKKNGAWGLMSGIGAAGWKSAKTTIKRQLREGALSSEFRFQKGVFQEGASSLDDIKTGGGDQVFTRLINQTTNQATSFPFQGTAQILWNLDSIAPRVPYAFFTDTFGVRNRYHESYDTYKKREGLLTFSNTCYHSTNEVMVKNAIDPSHIAGIAVENEAHKKELIQDLVLEGLAEIDSSGEAYIHLHGKKTKAEDFIHVRGPGGFFRQDWWG